MSFPVFAPKNKYRFYWDLLVVLGIAYSAIFVPLDIASNEHMTTLGYVIDTIFMIVFLLDIPVNFNTGVWKNNEFITDRKLIARKYVKGWFTVDFLSAFPFEIFAVIFFEGQGAEVATIFRLTKLLRLIKIARLMKLTHVARFITHLIGFDGVDPGYMRLLTFVWIVLLFSHVTACGWIFIDPVPYDDFTDRYVKALYWAITTLSTVGYGDITPKTTVQTIYTMFMMYTGVAIYAFIIGNIATLLANLNTVKLNFKNKLDEVNSFLLNKKVSPDLQKRINEYYQYIWDKKLLGNEEHIIADLPFSIQRELVVQLKSDFIKKVPIFEDAEDGLIEELVLHLKSEVYIPNDDVVTLGDEGDKMFFINNGNLDVIIEGGITVASLSDGNFFGEMALLMDTPRTATIRCKGYCELLSLNREDFESALENYPTFAEQMKRIAEERKH